MSRKLDWTLLLIQPFDCRPLLPISAYSGHFAPDFAPGFAPEIDPKAFEGQEQPLGIQQLKRQPAFLVNDRAVFDLKKNSNRFMA